MMTRPKNEAERRALDLWHQDMTPGSLSEAMLTLRRAGYSEPQRAAFLRNVVGVSESGLDELALHRDTHLDWLEQTAADSNRTGRELGSRPSDRPRPEARPR
jgi:hypothetical protein